MQTKRTARQGWDRIERALAIFAHCDDVEGGMGGTFARLSREGRRMTYVVSVENAWVGPHTIPRPPAREALAIRRAESTRASEILNAARLEFLAFKSFYFSSPDGKTQVYPTLSSIEAIKEEFNDVVFYGLPPVLNAYTIPACHDRLANLIREEQPQAIFTHSPDDRHQDHYCVARLVSLLVEDFAREGTDIDVWYGQPQSGGAMAEFWPDVFVELNETDVRQRLAATQCYTSQFPPESMPSKAQRCYEYGQVAGVGAAEAFRFGMWPRFAQAGADEIIARLAAGRPAPALIRLA